MLDFHYFSKRAKALSHLTFVEQIIIVKQVIFVQYFLHSVWNIFIALD